MSTRRQVNIFVNGKQVENSLRGIQKAKSAINAEIRDMVIGTEEYEKKVADLRELNKVFDEHRKKVSGIGQAVDGLTKGGLTKLAGLAGAAFSADVIISYGKELFKLGAEMQVLDAKAQTVFGTALPQVTAAAQANSVALGLTTSQYTNAAAAIGDLLIPMKFSRDEAANMSTQLVDLSGALSEWTGGQRSAEEVSQTLSKALLGEREELKGLGIAISEEDVKNRLRSKGLQDLTGDYLQQAKAVATMELILEKSTDAQTAFTNNSDTLVRRQAELRAQLAQVSETLARTLQPVFERLVGVAATFADGIQRLANGFTSLINPAKAANDAFTEQAGKVSKLEAELPPLLDRYDELKGKSKLTKSEQTELAKVIEKIGTLTPTAITEIDNYGNALSINATKSREFLAAEQKRLKFLNEEAITETYKQAKKLRELRDKVKSEVEAGSVVQTVRTGLGSEQQKIALTDKDIANKNKKVKELTDALEGARNQLKFLKGEPLVNPTNANKPAPTTSDTNLNPSSVVPSDKEIKSIAKQKEKEQTEIEKGEQAIQKILEKYRLENYLAQLDDDQKKIEQIRSKYDAEIAEIKILEAKKVKGATDARIELERLKQQEIDTITSELLTAQYQKEAEAQQAADEKKAAMIGESVAKELEAKAKAQEEIQAFVLTEQQKAVLELENQYLELINTTGLGEEQKLQLLQAYEEKKAALRKQFADKEKEELVTKTKERNDLLSQSYAAYANIIGGALTALGGILSEQTAAGKVLALAQIAFNTASAISGAISAGAGLVFPANLGAIATGVTAVLTNFAAARKILNDAPAIPQRYTGGFYDVTGATDGRSYNAQYLGQQNTGLLPPHPVLLASERGPEYLIANEDLRNPTVLNHVRAIENIRASRAGTVPQYADGGFSPPSAPNSAIPEQLVVVMANMMATNQALLQVLERGIPAVVGDNAIVDLEARRKVLNKASGGILGN